MNNDLVREGGTRVGKDLLTERNDLVYERRCLRDALRTVRALAFTESVSPMVGGLPDKVMAVVDEVLGDNGSASLRALFCATAPAPQSEKGEGT